MFVFRLIEAVQLKKAVSPLVQISKRATAICTEDGISLQTIPFRCDFGMVMAVLQIKSSDFDNFRCDRNCIGAVESVDLSVLNSILSTTTDIDAVVVVANYHDDRRFVHFEFFDDTNLIDDTDQYTHFHNTVSHRNRTLEYNKPRTPGDPYNYLGVNESEYEYRVILGIPSKEFRRILRYIRAVSTLIVDVFVTDASVLTFRSGSEDLILTKADGCIVWGADENEYVRLRMTLFHMDSFIEASKHSALVWMFKSPHWPDMLNCPIGAFANIKYYFDERYYLRNR